MQIVPLAVTANQSLSVRLDDTRIVLRLKEANGVMVADVSRDGVDIILGTRVVAGEPIIPYEYLAEGNFLVVTVGDELPAWADFDASQFLVYLSAAELAAIPGFDPLTGELAA